MQWIGRQGAVRVKMPKGQSRLMGAHKIRKYWPPAEEIIDLMETDVPEVTTDKRRKEGSDSEAEPSKKMKY